MKRRALSFLILFLFFSFLQAQEAIKYEVRLDNVQHHEIDIRVEFPSLPKKALKVHMPTASPGRYAEHNFAKNVYDVRAIDEDGKALWINKTAIGEWEVAGHDGYVRFEYTLFGNLANGTYTGIDNRKAHMNMPATFVYGKEMAARPIEITFNLSNHPDWTVATQLKQLSKEKFWAPNYAYFYDSPTIIGDIEYRNWTSSSEGKDYTIEIAMMHEGSDKELDEYTGWVKKVVEEQKAIYGSLPEFDFGRYTFLCSYNPWVDGDGMEHRNSTICSSTRNLKEYADRLIGTISHEFFHSWNVERIRPQSLEPFNFDDANMSGELWFAEGFTSYYTNLVLCRAGLRTPEAYLGGLAETINYITHSPGRQYHSPVEMSQMAPFVDAGAFNDPVNFSNTFISYYSYGSYLGLALDLTLRSKFEGATLDNLMRFMWDHFGRKEVPYQIEDIEHALAEITNDKEFASTFFDQFIYDSKLPDMEALLKGVGVVLRHKNPGQAGFYGMEVNFEEGGATISSSVLETNPLYKAGLNKGDKILSIAGVQPTAGNSITNSLSIGTEYTVKYLQNGIEYSATFTAVQDPTLEVLTIEKAGQQPDSKTLKQKNNWLSSKL